jgi:glucosamine--fructose-6-phosphate aminotransferase (isomerizing)
MCGIFGVVTDQEVELGPILIEAGRRLAYRGYDSVGCATLSADGHIDLRKDVGKISEVSARLRFAEMHGLRGIVQLRWATFGQPLPQNAQPHLDCDGDLVGAHNGNIVNNVQLRELFIQEGHTMRGENDGETCVHAVERYFDAGGDMLQAIRRAYADLSGDYAFIITRRDENRLYAIKKGSGLVAGLGEGLTCCSSDLPSILPLTRNILRVQDGEILVLCPWGVELRRVADGALINREPEFYAGDIDAAERGGYPHFMLKEVHEQPRLAGELLRLLDNSADVPPILESIRAADPVFFVGSGTSFHASLLGAYYFNRVAGKLVLPLLPMQFIEQSGASLDAGAAALFVSQSGETKDVLNAVKLAEAKRVRRFGVLNVLGSSLTATTERYLPLGCGYEISVPATKTFLSQAILFLYLAHRLAEEDMSLLARLPELLERTIEQTDPLAECLAERLVSWNDMYYLGYGLTHPIALEGALKLKEITYSHCEGIFSSEFKHGPLSAVCQGYPVVFITAPDDVEMMINHVNEVTCRQGLAIAIAEEDERLRRNVHEYVAIPAAGQLLFPILATLPAQLVAYYMSVKRGLNPDFPRNLSKTLTVD